MNQVVPRQESLPALIPPSKGLQMRLTQLSDAATDNRYPKKLTRNLVLARLGMEDEVQQALTYYRQSLAPASTDAILKHLLAMEVIFPSKELSRAQINLKYQLYYDALKDVPGPLLDSAFARYPKTPSVDGKQKFFPQPWEILLLIEDELKDARRQLRGIALIETAMNEDTVEDAADDPKNLTPEQIAKRKADVEALIAQVTEKQRAEREAARQPLPTHDSPERLRELKANLERRVAMAEADRRHSDNFYNRGD